MLALAYDAHQMSDRQNYHEKRTFKPNQRECLKHNTLPCIPIQCDRGDRLLVNALNGLAVGSGSGSCRGGGSISGNCSIITISATSFSTCSMCGTLVCGCLWQAGI